MQNVPKKRLGQHWLKDDASLNAMCEYGDVTKKDTVLEIGPGLGYLTEKILQRGAKVMAVEKDQDLVNALNADKSKFTNHELLTVVESDVREFNLLLLPKGYKVIANIPYYLTSNLVRHLLGAVNPPSLIVLLVQKEVAERITAGVGKKSILTISVEMFADVRLGTVVPAQLFTPPPKVDSQIVIFDIHEQPKLSVDQKNFFRLVKAGFSNKRKKLRSSLAGGLQISKTEAELILRLAHVDKDVRAQALNLDDWNRLYQTWTKTI